MNNILLVSAVFPPEPVVSASLSHDIAKSLSKKNQVTVLCPKPTRPHGFSFGKEIDSKYFKVLRLDSYTCSASRIIGRFRESYSFGLKCKHHIKNNLKTIDGIYMNTWPILSQFLVVRISKKNKIPSIVHVQDIYPESLSNKTPLLSSFLNSFLLPIDKYILRNASSIVAISDKMKNYLIETRNIKAEKITVVQNWQDESTFINHEKFDTLNRDENKDFTFMYLGNIGPVAGIDLLMNAFVNASLENCKLVIAGSGSMKESLQKKASDLKLTSIEFWPVPDGKVPEIQEHADVMLLPIKKGAAGSSIPSKLPAYMFSSKPIIACVDEDSDTATSINKANCGWVLPPNNIDELTQTMRMVAVSPSEKIQLKGNNGFEFAIEHFSKRKNLKKLCHIITNTILD